MYEYRRSPKILLNLEDYQLAKYADKKKLIKECNSYWKILLQEVKREVNIVFVVKIFEIMKELYGQNLSSKDINNILDVHFENFNNILTESNISITQDQKNIIYLIFSMIPEEPASFFYFWNKSSPISKNINEVIKFLYESHYDIFILGLAKSKIPLEHHIFSLLFELNIKINPKSFALFDGIHNLKPYPQNLLSVTIANYLNFDIISKSSCNRLVVELHKILSKELDIDENPYKKTYAIQCLCLHLAKLSCCFSFSEQEIENFIKEELSINSLSKIIEKASLFMHITKLEILFRTHFPDSFNDLIILYNTHDQNNITFETSETIVYNSFILALHNCSIKLINYKKNSITIKALDFWILFNKINEQVLFINDFKEYLNEISRYGFNISLSLPKSQLITKNSAQKTAIATGQPYIPIDFYEISADAISKKFIQQTISVDIETFINQAQIEALQEKIQLLTNISELTISESSCESHSKYSNLIKRYL